MYNILNFRERKYVSVLNNNNKDNLFAICIKTTHKGVWCMPVINYPTLNTFLILLKPLAHPVWRFATLACRPTYTRQYVCFLTVRSIYGYIGL